MNRPWSTEVNTTNNTTPPAMSWRSREKRPTSTKQVWKSSPSMRGPAYGVPHEATIETIRLAGQFEALPLDPVYSGKGLAGLIALIRQGRWRNDEDVIFLHTGGAPALFAYQSALGI